MEEKPLTANAPEALDELLEKHVRDLAEKLSRPYTIGEIEQELTSLNDLVYTFKRRDEILERLLDPSTPEDGWTRILDTLRAQHIEIARNRADAEKLRAKSQVLIQRANQLILQAQRQIDGMAHRHAGYALEPCGLCGGLGTNTRSPCAACNGKGSVLVHQPSIKCPRCGGDGKASGSQGLIYSSRICIICRGSGWVLTSD